MLKPVQVINTSVRGASPEWLVGLVREKTTQFDDERPARGYATTACLLITPYGEPILAFNDIPMVCEKDYSSTPRGVERAPKFAALGHAEVGAIAYAAQRGMMLSGATMVLAWFPCINCADAIVKAGIRRLIATRPDGAYKPATYDFPAAVDHLTRAGVEIVFVE